MIFQIKIRNNQIKIYKTQKKLTNLKIKIIQEYVATAINMI